MLIRQWKITGLWRGTLTQVSLAFGAASPIGPFADGAIQKFRAEQGFQKTHRERGPKIRVWGLPRTRDPGKRSYTFGLGHAMIKMNENLELNPTSESQALSGLGWSRVLSTPTCLPKAKLINWREINITFPEIISIFHIQCQHTKQQLDVLGEKLTWKTERDPQRNQVIQLPDTDFKVTV